MFWLKYVGIHSAWFKHVMLCRLYTYSCTESNFMIRNLHMAAVPGLIVSDVNCNFPYVHNHWLFFSASLEFYCFAYRGHCVLLKLGLQNTLTYEVLKRKKKWQHCWSVLLVPQRGFESSEDCAKEYWY